MKKEFYEVPAAEFVSLETKDVITGSEIIELPDDEL
jgi:hypothetical protein